MASTPHPSRRVGQTQALKCPQPRGHSTSPNAPGWSNRKQYTDPCTYNAGNRHRRCPREVAWHTYVGDLPDGINTVRLHAEDIIGHTQTRDWPVKVDRTPPELGEEDVQGTLKPEDREWVASGKQSLLIDATDATSGIVSAQVKIDGQLVKDGNAVEPCLDQGCRELSYDFLIDTDDIDPAEGEQPLSEGSHTATVTVRDAAGNEKTVGPWTIRQERTPPELTVTGALKLAEGQTLAEDSTYDLVATASEPSPSPAQSGMGTIDFVVDDEEPGDGVEEDCPLGGCPLTRDFSYSTDEYGGGGHTVRVIATDRAGNTTEQSVSVNQPADPVHECDTAPMASPVVNPQPLLPSFALVSFQSALPEAFAPSTVLDLGQLQLLPALNGSNPLEFVATGVFSGVKVDRVAAEGATITVDGGEGAICMTPTTVALGASQLEPSVNGVTALFANSGPATDTAIRPSVTGVSSLLQLRGATAPEQFSWHVDLQPELELKELADGNVAVVLPADPETDVEMADPLVAPTVAEQQAALPATGSHLSQDESELARIQSEQPDEIVAVIRKPWAKGPQGQELPTSLSATETPGSPPGSIVTMTVEHTDLCHKPPAARLLRPQEARRPTRDEEHALQLGNGRRRKAMSARLRMAILAGVAFAALGMGATSAEHGNARTRNGLIAYTQETNRCGDLGCESYVWTARTDGRAKRRLSCSTAQARRLGCVDVFPDFAPDGRLLATATGGVSEFTEDDQPKDIVAIRRPRGDVLTRIPEFGRQMTALAWSPDGARLAVGTSRSIYIVARDGAGETLFRRTRVADLDWSSRGRLAWTTEFGARVFVTNDDRSRVRTLPAKAFNIAWSPSGQRLAYVTPKNVVRTIGANGRSRRTVTRRCTGDQVNLSSGVAWSPDGRELLCTAGVNSTRLIAVNVRTDRTRIIVRGTKKLAVTSFDWQRAPRK